MKSSFKPIILFILFSFAACKKSDNSPTTTTGTAAVVKAQNFGFDGLAGTSFTSNAAGIVKVGNIITISAKQDGTTNSISIVLSNVTAAGTFTLNEGNAPGNGAIISKDSSKPTDTSLNYSTDNSGGGMNGGGQVVITSLTATDAEGTFYITAYNRAGKAAFAEQGTFKGHIN
jgi:hypothetical protein